MRIIGEAQQQWAPLRRKYNLFLYHQTPNSDLVVGSHKFHIPDADISKAQQMQLTHAAGEQAEGEFVQFAYVDEPFLSWDFSLRAADAQLIGSVNRNFSGFAREIFTDTGVYALRMDAAALAEQRDLSGQISTAYPEKGTGMTLDQRAVMLATAVSIDFDYFSRHSGSGVGIMPIWFPIGGAGEAAAGGTAAGEAGAAGTAVGEAATGAVGRAGAAGSMAEGAAAGAAGAGTIAGYEAMQRGMTGDRGTAPPGQQQPYDQPQVPPGEQPGAGEELWDEEEDPWGAGPGDEGGDGGDGGWF